LTKPTVSIKTILPMAGNRPYPSKKRMTMQVKDEDKRLRILTAAAERFALLPFHKVLLSDVANAAGVGKGKFNIYFKSNQHYLRIKEI
jgi:AcrR family transcriptional regulator